MKMFLRPLAIAFLLATWGSQSFAQFNGGAGGGGMGSSRHSRGADTADKSAGNGAGLSGPQLRSSQLNEKLGDLRLRLSITPDQSDPWLDFYNRVFDLLDRSHANQQPPENNQTAPQALQQRLADAQGRTASLQRVNEAVAKLYTALTPDQKHIADQYLPLVIP